MKKNSRANSKPMSEAKKAEAALRAFSLRFPGAREELRAWIDESYRAIAPKTLVAKVPPVT